MRKFCFFLLLFFAFLLIYYPALFNFFAQDDFSLLLISQAKNFREFLQFLKPLNTAIFYRPLSMQLYFYLIRTLFGLRPFAFHLIAFLFHFANSFLVYHLIKILTKNRSIALAISFCFAVSSIHFMSLFWVCEFSLILSAFFCFLSLISYFKQKQFLFILCFFLALLSNEFSATLPFIILSYHFILKKPFSWKKLLLPIGFIAFFIFLRFFWFPTSLGEFYKLVFTLQQFLSNLRWYLIRSLSLPELIKDYLEEDPLLKINLLSSLIFLFSGFLLPNFLSFKKKRSDFRMPLFAFSWFVLSLAPVIFMPKHLLSSYLTLGLPGILLFWLNNLSSVPKQSKNFFFALTLTAFFLSSLLSVRFLAKHHWIIYRAKMAEKNLKSLLRKYPKFAENSIVYFQNKKPDSSRELYFAMAGEAAVKVFYNNPRIEVFFEDFTSLPKNLKNKKVYLFSVISD